MKLGTFARLIGALAVTALALVGTATSASLVMHRFTVHLHNYVVDVPDVHTTCGEVRVGATGHLHLTFACAYLANTASPTVELTDTHGYVIGYGGQGRVLFSWRR